MQDDLPYAFDQVEGKQRRQRSEFDTVNDGSSTLGVERNDGPVVLQLHPDLARLAVRYQRIRSERIQGRISDGEAAVALSELVARDDFGMHWSINQRDGGWQFLSADRTWQPGEPPTEGIATATAHALDKAAGGETRWDNPDLVIGWVAPEQQPDSWDSALSDRSTTYGFERPRWLYPVAVAAVLAAAAAVFLVGRSSETLDAPVVTPAVTQTFTPVDVPVDVLVPVVDETPASVPSTAPSNGMLSAPADS